MSFITPWGWLALLGIPAILAIHFLQRRTRVVEVSTLFLLERIRPESRTGRHLDWLRSSLSLWLQLLAVLLIAWLLAGPQFLRRDARQRVVVLLDSSASMLAFRDSALSRLSKRLHELNALAPSTQWIALESSIHSARLYAGDDLRELVKALQHWTPARARHDSAQALSTARSLQGAAGRLIHVTDHDPGPLTGVEILSVGEPTAQVGFAGVRVEEERWRALVRNYGDQPQTRSWRLLLEGKAGPPQSLDLAANALLELGGTFPKGHARFELQLDEDAFILDDRLPVISPRPKNLRVCVEAHGELEDYLTRFLAAGESLTHVLDSRRADLWLGSKAQGGPDIPSTIASVIFEGVQKSAEPETSIPVAAAHPLLEGLNWGGLILHGTSGLVVGDDDLVLLWSGHRPLIALRQLQGGASSLRLGFDLEHSNAGRLPPLVVLLHRFLGRVRADTPGFERLQFEAGQVLRVSLSAAGPPLEVTEGDIEPIGSESGTQQLRAPLRPGFFKLQQGPEPRVEAAAHFADSAEADLRKAQSFHRVWESDAQTLRQHSDPDPLTPLWLLLLAALLLFEWSLHGRTRA